MRAEKIILSCIAIIVGLLVAGIAFFIYQSTKTIPPSKLPKITISSSSPTIAQENSNMFLSVDQPADESVTDSKTLTINGKTNPENTIIINTPIEDQVITPAQNGNYSITATIDTGENQIVLTAINPNGEELRKILTVTYSTEQF